MATVHVSSSSRGFINGQLDWMDSPSEDVEFSLIEVKPGYVVVGEVGLGPEFFSKACWKLKSVNGQTDVGPGGIKKGDKLVLDSPTWALEGLSRIQAIPSSAPAKSFHPGAPKAPPEPKLGGTDDANIPLFHVPPASNIARPAPVVPRLDLTNLAQQRRRAAQAAAGEPKVNESESDGWGWLRALISCTSGSGYGAGDTSLQCAAQCGAVNRCV